MKMDSHGIHDLHDAPGNSRWYPYTPEAVQLALCIESCKQINELRPMLHDGSITPRRLTIMVTPLYNLIEHVLKLTGLLHTADRSLWREFDRASFRETPRMLKKIQIGTLRTIRNKRAAHADEEGLSSRKTPPSTAVEILPAIAAAACQLLLCIQHEAVFGYRRIHDPSKPHEVEFFVQYPLASTFRVDESGRRVELLHSHLEADPRQELSGVVRETIDLYNTLAPQSALPTIALVPYEENRGLPADVRLI